MARPKTKDVINITVSLSRLVVEKLERITNNRSNFINSVVNRAIPTRKSKRILVRVKRYYECTAHLEHLYMNQERINMEIEDKFEEIQKLKKWFKKNGIKFDYELEDDKYVTGIQTILIKPERVQEKKKMVGKDRK